MNAIEIKDLSKTYRGKKGLRVDALKKLNLEVAPGEVFGFLGPNGAGKSTTIKTLTGQIPATSGSACLFGVPVHDPVARMRVGYLPENPAFYDFMTAREYLRFVGKNFGMSAEVIVSETERVLSLMELSYAASRPIRGYSKGMVQRLGLAQALLSNPDLFILDEPMSGLDPLGRALVKDVIKELKSQGKAVFFSTHITSDIEVVCDRVGVIVQGKLMVVDEVKKILEGGLEGFDLQVLFGDGRVEEIVASKENLKEVLKNCLDQGASVERIEPRRKDLETFFLDIVAQANDADKNKV